jgi:hypothetical protein
MSLVTILGSRRREFACSETRTKENNDTEVGSVQGFSAYYKGHHFVVFFYYFAKL